MPIQNDRMYIPDSEEGIVIGEGYGVEASKFRAELFGLERVELSLCFHSHVVYDDSEEDGIAFSFR